MASNEARESEAVSASAPPHDPVLGLYIDLVEFAEVTDRDVSVTLSLGGMLVSGDIISANDYFQATGMQKVVDTLRPDEKVPDRIWLEPRTYIHLKDARFFMGAHVGIPNNHGVIWRGRLSEVTGFNLGKLASSVG